MACVPPEYPSGTQSSFLLRDPGRRSQIDAYKANWGRDSSNTAGRRQVPRAVARPRRPMVGHYDVRSRCVRSEDGASSPGGHSLQYPRRCWGLRAPQRADLPTLSARPHSGTNAGLLLQAAARPRQAAKARCQRVSSGQQRSGKTAPQSLFSAVFAGALRDRPSLDLLADPATAASTPVPGADEPNPGPEAAQSTVHPSFGNGRAPRRTVTARDLGQNPAFFSS